jgi:shikimate dehydrogenase
MNSDTDQYVVVGHPIGHSRSPFIHRLFAEQTGECLEYGTLDIEPAQFVAKVQQFVASGGRGMNVTVPLKELAFTYATHRSERAQRAGAVNTLQFGPGSEVLGDNTDGVGLITDLSVNLRRVLTDARILLLGAGGASRGVLGPLLDLKPRDVLVANRTGERALQLAQLFEADGAVRACTLNELPDTAFDVIINATAAGLSGEQLPLRSAHLTREALCYDMMYGAEPTVFVTQMRALGAARAVDGRGMLVEQAAESFVVWRGIRPSTAAVIARLSESLAATL